MSHYQLYQPVAATNILTNPSVEFNTTGYVAANSATVGSTTDAAAFGVSSLSVTPDSASIVSGVEAAVTLTASAWYTFSAFVLGAAGVTYTIYAIEQTSGVDGGTATFVGTGDWERQEVTFQATGPSTGFDVGVGRTTSGTTAVFYVDALQLESATDASSTATTYIDGDQPGCRWNGAWHASTSSRSDQWRGGGRIVDLRDFGFLVRSHAGTGSAGYTNVHTDGGIIGGATFQRSIVQTRAFALTGVFTGGTVESLHSQHQALLDALKPNLVSPQQPVVLRYTGNGSPRIIYCHYETGLDDAADYPRRPQTTIRFIAFDPYWYSEHMGSKRLAAFDTITDANYIVERGESGTWHALAGGLGGGAPIAVYAVVYGQDGNLYAGGQFVEAYNAAGGGSAITVNHVARWDGTQWAALGSGFNGPVQRLALAPDGTLYAVGLFDDAAYPHLAAWDGSAWSAVGGPPTGSTGVYAVTYNPHDGRLYVGGVFTEWDSVPNTANIAVWDGSAWVSIGESNGRVWRIVVDRDGSILVGGAFTEIGIVGVTPGVTVTGLARYTPSTGVWSSLGAAFAVDAADPLDMEVFALAVDRAGRIYAGGHWTEPTDHPYLAMYTGGQWTALGSGVDDDVYALSVAPAGYLVVAGQFTTAGDSSLRDRTAVWNGSAWEPMLIDLPGSAIVWDVAHSVYTNEFAIGYDTPGTAISTNIVDTEIVNDGTEDAAPAIHIVCPVGATGEWTVEAITNWDSGKSIFFDGLTVRPGEVIVLDLSVLTPQYLPTLYYTDYGRSGPRLWSNFRGDVTRLIAPNSDLATWRLLPGRNVVLVKMRGTTDTDAFFSFQYRLRYLGVDG